MLHQVDPQRPVEAEERGPPVGVELGQDPARGLPEQDHRPAVREVLPAEARQGEEEPELPEREPAADHDPGRERPARQNAPAAADRVS